MEITLKDFMRMQPNYPRVTDADQYYYKIAVTLGRLWDNSRRFMQLPEATRRAVVLAVTGYYQDVIADAGLWRAFVMMHQHLYGKPLPFYPRRKDYVDYELNLDDVRFVIWYTIEGQQLENFTISPLDDDIEWLAGLFHKVLSRHYESAPNPTEYNIAVGVDTNDVADADAIYDLSHWLFFNSYFMRPGAKVAMTRSILEARDIISKTRKRDQLDKLRDLNDRTMLANPTGPLALPIGQWVELIVNAKLPDEPAQATEPHRLYADLLQATGGSELAFFGTYEELEDFLAGAMHWDRPAEGIFPALKGHSNFVVLGNRAKGMLIAPDVAQLLAHEANPLYNQEVAAREAHTLITQPGRAPVDLVRYAFAHNLVPDASLPLDDTGRLLHDNWDFLLRLYHQPPVE